MLGFISFVGVMSGAIAVLTLLDAGAREHLVMRFASAKVDTVLARQSGHGSVVQDLRPLTPIVRRGGRRFAATQIGILALAVALMDLTRWPRLVIVAVAVLLLLSATSRGTVIFRVLGYEDPSVVRTWRGRLVDGVAYAVKGGLLALSLLVVAMGGDALGVGRIAEGWGLTAAGFLVVWFSNVPSRSLLRRTLGWVQPDPGFGAQADRQSLLLLRSFGDDGTKLRTLSTVSGPSCPVVMGPRERFEELLAAAIIVSQSRLVAIGRPGERLPELGAARTYYPDDDWQDAVRVTAARSAAVLLVAGRTEGLAWEVEQLRAWGLLNKTLVLLPPESDPDAARDRFQRVWVQLSDGQPIPEAWHPSLWVAVSVKDGVMRQFVSDGRDWASYVTAVLVFLSELRGSVATIGTGSRAESDATRDGVDAATRYVERLPAATQARLLWMVGKGNKRAERSDLPGALRHFGDAEAAALDAGATGAVTMVKSITADALRDAGHHEEAQAGYQRVVEACQRGFASFGWAGETVSALDLEVDALGSLASLAGGHQVGDPEPVFIALHDALVRARRWQDAGEVAETIGTHQTRTEGVDEWFRRARQHMDRIGHQVGLSQVEMSWGAKLLGLGQGRAAVPHLTSAVALFGRSGMPEQAAAADTLVTQATAVRATEASRRWFDLFDVSARRLLVRSQDEANRRGDEMLKPEHLLLAIGRLDQCLAREILIREGVRLDDLEARLEASLGPTKAPREEQLPFSSAAKRCLDWTFDDAAARESDRIGSEHLLASLVRTPSPAADILTQLGFDSATWRRVFDTSPDESLPLLVASTVTVAEPVSTVLMRPLRAVDWELGWGGFIRSEQPVERPVGLPDDGPLGNARRTVIRAILLAGNSAPIVPLKLWCCEVAARLAVNGGSPGAALCCRAIQAQMLVDAGRYGEAIRVQREILASPEPGWITVPDDPLTGAELFDRVLQSMSELTGAMGDGVGRVEIERSRMALAPRLRDPLATLEATCALAYALAKAGQHEEAETWFSRVRPEDGAEGEFLVIRAANDLCRGDIDAASTHLELGRPTRGRNWGFPGPFGVEGDLAWARGAVVAAGAAYQEGLRLALETADLPSIRRFEERLAALEAQAPPPAGPERDSDPA